MNALLAEKLRLLRGCAEGARGLEDFAAECASAAKEYERVWLVRHKPERLHEILAVFGRLAEEAQALASGEKQP
jgi:hypothetical protein